MITRNEGEQLARGLNAVRPDWPTEQLLTLIGELKAYPLRDIGCALMWVALDQDHAGNPLSQSPYRVKEQSGEWWRRLRDPAERMEAERRAAERAAKARTEIQERSERIRKCWRCDDEGYTDGHLCRHGDIGPEDRAARAKERADQARAAFNEARKARPAVDEPENA